MGGDSVEQTVWDGQYRTDSVGVDMWEGLPSLHSTHAPGAPHVCPVHPFSLLFSLHFSFLLAIIPFPCPIESCPFCPLPIPVCPIVYHPIPILLLSLSPSYLVLSFYSHHCPCPVRIPSCPHPNPVLSLSDPHLILSCSHSILSLSSYLPLPVPVCILFASHPIMSPSCPIWSPSHPVLSPPCPHPALSNPQFILPCPHPICPCPHPVPLPVPILCPSHPALSLTCFCPFPIPVLSLSPSLSPSCPHSALSDPHPVSVPILFPSHPALCPSYPCSHLFPVPSLSLHTLFLPSWGPLVPHPLFFVLLHSLSLFFLSLYLFLPPHLLGGILGASHSLLGTWPPGPQPYLKPTSRPLPS